MWYRILVVVASLISLLSCQGSDKEDMSEPGRGMHREYGHEPVVELLQAARYAFEDMGAKVERDPGDSLSVGSDSLCLGRGRIEAVKDQGWWCFFGGAHWRYTRYQLSVYQGRWDSSTGAILYIHGYTGYSPYSRDKWKFDLSDPSRWSADGYSSDYNAFFERLDGRRDALLKGIPEPERKGPPTLVLILLGVAALLFLIFVLPRLLIGLVQVPVAILSGLGAILSTPIGCILALCITVVGILFLVCNR